jgi:glycosyltransferase involved in cell wall biosynthesis
MTRRIPASLSVMHLVSGDLYAGAERVVEELALAQRQLPQLEVEVVLLNDGELASRLRVAGVATRVFPETKHGAAALLRLVIARARAARPDLIHTHRFKEHVLGSLAARWCGIGSIRTVHGAPEFRRTRTLRGRLIDALDYASERFFQQRAAYVSEDLLRIHRGERRAAVVIRNGIDPARVIAASERAVDPLAGDLRVGVFARLVAVKRVHLAIDAVAEAQRKLDRKVVLHIFGDGPLRPALEEHARSRPQTTVVFHGHTPFAPAYMRQMHAVLLTSSHEGLPIAVLEAMSLGVAVVATDAGGLPEVLSGGEAGWLAPGDGPHGYALALVEALIPSPRRAAKLESARERMATLFSARRMAEDYLRLYEAVRAERVSAPAHSAE